MAFLVRDLLKLADDRGAALVDFCEPLMHFELGRGFLWWRGCHGIAQFSDGLGQSVGVFRLQLDGFAVEVQRAVLDGGFRLFSEGVTGYTSTEEVRWNRKPWRTW